MKAILLFLVFFNLLLCSKELTIDGFIANNPDLLNEKKEFNKFIILYRSTLSNQEEKELDKILAKGKNEQILCLQKVDRVCVRESFKKMKSFFKEEYVERHHLQTLKSIFKTVFNYYHLAMEKENIEIKYHVKGQKNKICMSVANEKRTNGTLYLIRLYYILSAVFHQKEPSIRDYNFLNRSYKHQSLVEYILKNFMEKKLEKYASLTIKEINKKDLEDIYNSLLELKSFYSYYLSHINVSKYSINNANLELNVCEYTNSDGISHHSYNALIKVNDKVKNVIQLNSTTEFMYTFWYRRDMGGNLDKSMRLLIFVLNSIQEKLFFDDITWKDFQVKNIYTKTNSSLIQKGFGRSYRTRLKKALKEKKPEFSGKHIISKWGCDEGENGCTTGGIIDVSTGKATEFPFKQYEHNGEKEIIYKLDSSLIVFVGDFKFKDGRTQKNKVLFYEFKDGEFLFLKGKSGNR